MRLKPVRALTRRATGDTLGLQSLSSNEVEAREGIDTRKLRKLVSLTLVRSNEVEAREGIDTFFTVFFNIITPFS